MVAVQAHRGPDDTGTYLGDGVGLGHNRLSIIDLSAAGHQPMSSFDGVMWVVFNGEIYNYVELREELDAYPFRSETDTEVILAAYRRWGKSCVDHFNGMFSFAVWDTRERVLFCARDRLGIKPFHYAWLGGRFMFASEIKALLAAGLPAAPAMPVWADYLSHGYYDHRPDTFFEGVRALPPGHTLTVKNGREQLSSYWSLGELDPEPTCISDSVAEHRFRELLADSVRLRLRSDVPVGVNLSGGLDSASLMVTVDDQLEGEGAIETFTAGFVDSDYDEVEWAAAVPQRRRWVRNVSRVGPGAAWNALDKTMWHQEAPFGGVATLAYHCLHGVARDRGVTVLLEGQGVDEMFAGYGYFRPHFFRDLLESGQHARLRRELRAFGDPRGDLRRLRRLLRGEDEPRYQDGTSHLRPECVDTDVHALAGDVPSFDTPFGHHVSNALYRDLRHTKLPRVLRMNDRLSMAFGRELREPYLDHRLVEFAFSLPSAQKLRSGTTKSLLRRAMAGRLPDQVRGLPKRAVVTPQREWLRGELRPQIEDIVQSQSFRERGFFDAAAVATELGRFMDGRGDNAFFIWQWVNLELWFRTFVDDRIRRGPGSEGSGEAPYPSEGPPSEAKE